jgi:hypothetical protein
MINSGMLRSEITNEQSLNPSVICAAYSAVGKEEGSGLEVKR